MDSVGLTMSDLESIQNDHSSALSQGRRARSSQEWEDGVAAESTPDSEADIEANDLEADDEPVQMYPQQVGRVPLLTKKEESALAMDIEKGGYIKRLEQEYEEKHARLPAATDTAIVLLEKLAATMPVFEAIEEELGLSVDKNLASRMSRPEIRTAVDGKLDESLIEGVSRALGIETNLVIESAKEFSLASSLVPPEIATILEDKTTTELTEIIRGPGFAGSLIALEHQIQKHMQSIKERGKEAKKRFIEANMGLVKSKAMKIAKKSQLSAALDLDDLIQEGSLGLMSAVEKYDYRLGYRFTTYATPVISGEIIRAIQKARTIHIPVNKQYMMKEIRRERERLSRELGRELTVGEVADRMGMPLEEVKQIRKVYKEPISLESPVGEETGTQLAELVEDPKALADFEDALKTDSVFSAQELALIMSELDPRERRVFRLRFVPQDGRRCSIKEASEILKIGRDRVTEIEKEALRKLRHPAFQRRYKRLND